METLTAALAQAAMALLAPPLMLGVIARTKAVIAGRQGPPLLQPIYDLVKLLGKGAVYSTTTTWVFRLGPVASLAAALTAALLVPFGSQALAPFTGDAIVFAYLFGLGRFVTVCAALDTGSSFEGMGASREVAFSSLAEPALILAFAALALHSGTLSMTPMFCDHGAHSSAAVLILLVGSLFIVLLAENSRIPVDDPNTHLELTMIHEVMVLDHGGPDLAFILYGAALKLTLMAALLVHLVLPAGLDGPAAWSAMAAGLAGLAIIIGLVESCMARLRLVRIPQLLVASVCASAFGLVLTLR